MKWTVGSHFKAELRKAFETGLGVTRNLTDGPMDVYSFLNNSWIAIEFVAHEEALSADQLKKAPWLEFCVDDVETTAERLRQAGAQRVDYTDKTHHYFQLPGGPVFRLAGLE